MTVAISNAVAEGAKAVVCASTGNTSASMAAYAARAGLTPIVLVPHGRIAAGKMAQAVMFGAEVIQINGGFDECLNVARGLADNYPVSLVNSVNPMRLQGQKTAAFGIVAQLGQAPDLHVMPVGNAGNISAYWMGFKELALRPRMWGFQAAGAAPIVVGHPIANPETVASAIRIGNPASWDLAVAARDESGGIIAAVTDEQILAAQRALASHDGIFVEPASAAGVAGLIAAAEAGNVDAGQTISVTVTGNGLKDIETALSGIDSIVDSVVDADVDAAARAAGLA
jgi:threonine synthase